MSYISEVELGVSGGTENVYVLPASADLFGSIQGSLGGQSQTVYVGQLETVTTAAGETTQVVQLAPGRPAPASRAPPGERSSRLG